MKRQTTIQNFEQNAGSLSESNEGQFTFEYSKDYLSKCSDWVSLTLPIKNESRPIDSDRLFAFFDGLIPEGWMLLDRFWIANGHDSKSCRDQNN